MQTNMKRREERRNTKPRSQTTAGAEAMGAFLWLSSSSETPVALSNVAACAVAAQLCAPIMVIS